MTLSRDARQILLGIGIGIVLVTSLAGIYVAGQRSTRHADSVDPVAAKMQMQSPSKPAPEPMFGWLELPAKDIVLNPGTIGMLFDVSPSKTTPAEFSVRGFLPVTAGLFRTSHRQLLSDGTFNSAAALADSPCVQHQMIFASVLCGPENEPMTMFVMDERQSASQQPQVLDLLGRALVKHYTGASLPTKEEHPITNHVTVTPRIFGCVANCEGGQPASNAKIVGTPLAQSVFLKRMQGCNAAADRGVCAKAIIEEISR